MPTTLTKDDLAAYLRPHLVGLPDSEVSSILDMAIADIGGMRSLDPRNGNTRAILNRLTGLVDARVIEAVGTLAAFAQDRDERHRNDPEQREHAEEQAIEREVNHTIMEVLKHLFTHPEQPVTYGGHSFTAAEVAHTISECMRAFPHDPIMAVAATAACLAARSMGIEPRDFLTTLTETAAGGVRRVVELVNGGVEAVANAAYDAMNRARSGLRTMGTYIEDRTRFVTEFIERYTGIRRDLNRELHIQQPEARTETTQPAPQGEQPAGPARNLRALTAEPAPAPAISRKNKEPDDVHPAPVPVS